MTPKYSLPYFEFQYLNVRYHAWMFYLAGSLHSLLTNHARCCVCCLCRRTNPTVISTVSISVTAWYSVIYFDITFIARHFTVRRRRSLSITTVLNYAMVNPLNPELNPICYLLALLGAHHFLHVSRLRAKSLTFRLLMSYIYGAPILDVSRSHTTTQHSR